MGAQASGTVPVTPGETLYLEVNVLGGAGGLFAGSSPAGGAGGGESDVRTCSATATTCASGTTLGSRLLVAGGGGGTGVGGQGGGAGGTPSPGGTGATSRAGNAGGTGATDTAPGQGGSAGSSGTGTAGTSGDASGGAGGAGGPGKNGGGGGGGGDFTGGEGGGGGGGGSSHAAASVLGATFVQETAGQAPSVSLSYMAPTASITTPSNAASYAFGQQVTSSFTCVDVTGGPGISSCLDQDGNPSGSPVDTSTAGSHTFTVTATDVNGLAGEGSVNYTVAKGSQSIAFTSTPPSAAVFGGSYTPAATGGGSGNPVVFSVDSSSGSGVCSLSSGTVSFTGVGTCVVDADQAGDANYDAAAQRQQSFTVAKASQAIAFTSSPPSPGVFGGSYTPAATGGGSGNPVVFSIDSSSGLGVCSISSGTVSFTGAGTCVIDADQAGNAKYASAARQKQSLEVVKSPSVQISSPADGQTFALGEHVVTSFSCVEGSEAPGLSSCTDASGAQGPSGVLDTSRPGTFTYKVTATSKDGQTGTASIAYTVAAAPSVSISSPARGAAYALGQAVVVSYSCQDGASGPGIRSCAGTLRNGASLDISTPGQHSFTVTATSHDGQSTTNTVSYRVTRPSNRLVERPRPKPHSDGTFVVTVKVPGPGRVDILVTAWNDNVAHIAALLHPAPGRFVFARAHATASTAKTVRIVVRPNAKGRRLANHHRYRVTLRLWVTYKPAGGKLRSIGYYGLHLP